jgi:hypothetical protein
LKLEVLCLSFEKWKINILNFFLVIFDASGLLGGITNNGKRMTKGDEFDQFKAQFNKITHTCKCLLMATKLTYWLCVQA